MLRTHPSSFTKVLDGPDNGEQDGAAADDVHQVQDVAPGEPRPRSWGVLIQDDYCYLSAHLRGRLALVNLVPLITTDH